MLFILFIPTDIVDLDIGISIQTLVCQHLQRLIYKYILSVKEWFNRYYSHNVYYMYLFIGDYMHPLIPPVGM
jgi:hypothetical protein